MAYYNLIIKVLFVFCYFIFLKNVVAETGICTVTEQIPREITYTYREPFIERYWGWCWSGSCQKTRTSFRTKTASETHYEHSIKKQCCDGFKGDPNIGCEPICETVCKNSFCSKPNVCTCNEGFVQDLENHFKCIPYCSRGCTNGICESPDYCKCLEGFVHESSDNSHYCVPYCNQKCIHGFCSAPEECTCDPGFGRSDEDAFKCTPICSNSCLNGKCVAPDFCQCNKGFIKNLKTDSCEPVCDPKCTNGFCESPNKCKCNEGFENQKLNTFLSVETNTTNQCSPVCSKTCNNGICSAPETCSCFEGFILNPDNQYECSPVCEIPCENGICTGPNFCTCNEGYSKNSSECVPNCSKNCTNGLCTFPNNCSCNEGYQRNESFCDPVCSSPCINGYCSAPEICSCYPGFIQDVLNKSLCRPVCIQSCDNGTCTAPNQCTCNPGFKATLNSSLINLSHCQNDSSCPDQNLSRHKQNITCEPICDPDCCTGPDECNCNVTHCQGITSSSLLGFRKPVVLAVTITIVLLVFAMLIFLGIFWKRNKRISYKTNEDRNENIKTDLICSYTSQNNEQTGETMRSSSWSFQE